MEGLYFSSKSSKLKPLDGNVSPIAAKRDNLQIFVGDRGRYHRSSKSPTFDSYASVDDCNNLQNLDSTLIRYLRSVSPAASVGGDSYKSPSSGGGSSVYRQMAGNNSGGSSGGSRGTLSLSPLSAMQNLETPPMFGTPLKVEEDVVVMDGVLVASLPGARVRSSMSSDSGGSSSSGSNSHFKKELCRPWEDSGNCRYGSKCQYAHGKEELRPSRSISKTKSEAHPYKSYSSSGSCNYGSKCRFFHHQLPMGSPPTESAARGVSKTRTITPTKPKPASGSSNADWSPLNDGIEAAFPSSGSADGSSPKEDVDAYIHSVLYGPSRRKRLPVFEQICPS